ncbi:MAG: RNA methyltransferase [Oscillospiraceae bacterium]|nr:RNA methyltransferase [Oscillospiraceae bacterium]
MTERITSRQNPFSAHVRRLGRSRAYRREQGAFLCEGPKLLDEALRWGAVLETVVTGEDPPLHLPDGTRHVTVPDDLLRYLSDTETPQGVLAVCSMPELTQTELIAPGRYLVLDGVQDPGNVGTIWRTADAFGADGIFLLPGCADPYAPKTVRATMGACFRLPVWESEPEALQAALRAAGLPLYAAALRQESEDIRRFSASSAAVVIGSEGGGVSPAVLARCDGLVHIPMQPQCESLNAAVAAAVVLWELYR